MATGATEYGIVKAKRPWYKKKRFLIPIGFAALSMILGPFLPDSPEAAEVAGVTATVEASAPPEPSATAESPSAEPTGPSAEEVAAQEEADRVAAEEAAAAKAAAAEQAAAEEAARMEEERVAAEQAAAAAAQGSVSQQNAYRSAVDYLDFGPFSRNGLIEQLTSEYGSGFPAADAEFAVSRLEAEGGVDWNAEAAEAAQDYLEFSSFSRDGLIEQLTSEFGSGFTQEQAEYGVSQTGL